MLQRPGLEVMRDVQGSATLGWVSPGVLYTRSEGGLSRTLGGSYANRLERLIRSVPALEYFGDASAVTQYDLLARSAFVRVVQAHRRKFTSITILTWQEGISSAAGRFLETLGQGAQLLTEKNEFMKRLTRSAPRAHQLVAVCDAQAKAG